MMCSDCCAFHDALRWLGNAFSTGEFFLGLALGIFGLFIFIILIGFLFDF